MWARIVTAVCGLCAAAGAHAAAPAYAPLKARLCSPCTAPLLPVELPRHGFVQISTSIMSDGGTWFVVDFGAAEAIRLRTRFDRTARRNIIVQRVTRPLLPGELAELIALANRIWASKEPLPLVRAYDAIWELWLYDGAEVRRDGGPGVADGPGKELEQILDRLVGYGVPVQQE